MAERDTVAVPSARLRWRTAMARALYGPDGFFVGGEGPAAHFRTSVHASPVFCAALVALVGQVDEALGRPDLLDVVDVGAGRGELLTGLMRFATPSLAARLRLTAVEVSPRPPDLPAAIRWRDSPPDGVVGLLVATEWLDNVPLDVVVGADDGWRTVLVDRAGVESVGGPADSDDAAWLATWWTESTPGLRAEAGRTRDLAWADAVGRIERGLALAVDYGHLRPERPVDGTLTAYRDGRQVPPVPDGSCDLTAHVAIDAVAAAGSAVAGLPYALVRQREALRALGVDGRRPPLSMAGTDPAGYLRALAVASSVAELTDQAGLGAHWWLLQPVGVEPSTVMARWRA